MQRQLKRSGRIAAGLGRGKGRGERQRERSERGDGQTHTKMNVPNGYFC